MPRSPDLNERQELRNADPLSQLQTDTHLGAESDGKTNLVLVLHQPRSKYDSNNISMNGVLGRKFAVFLVANSSSSKSCSSSVTSHSVAINDWH